MLSLLSTVCSALGDAPENRTAVGEHQHPRPPASKRQRVEQSGGAAAAERWWHTAGEEGDVDGGDASAGPDNGNGALAAGRRGQRRVPDERRRLSRQISAYRRLGVLVLPQEEGADAAADAPGTGAALGTLLQRVFGDSIAAWCRVQNWFYLHAEVNKCLRLLYTMLLCAAVGWPGGIHVVRGVGGRRCACLVPSHTHPARGALGQGTTAGNHRRRRSL